MCYAIGDIQIVVEGIVKSLLEMELNEITLTASGVWKVDALAEKAKPNISHIYIELGMQLIERDADMVGSIAADAVHKYCSVRKVVNKWIK